MFPLAIPIIAAAVKIGSSVLANKAAGGANSEQDAAYAQAVEALRKQGIMNPEEYIANYAKIDPNQLQYANPLLEQNIDAGPTELKNIQGDPLLRQAQMDALSKMSQRGEQGLTIEEEAARNNIVNTLGANQKSQQENILQNLAQRGQLGAGTEVAARMAALQNAYSNAAQQGQDLAAAREKRAFDATQAAGTMGGNLRSQDYGEASNAAQAQDLINRFNVQNQQSVGQRNVGAQNTAAQNAANLKNQAYTSNLNLQNTQADQLVKGKQLTQEQKNQQAKDVAKLELDKAALDVQRAQSKGKGIANIGSGIASSILGFGS